MKIYVAYKFSDQDLANLEKSLSAISKALEQAGHQTFIFFRDIQHWGEAKLSSKDVITQALSEINNCDAILALADIKEKSEGMLLEIGYAKALNKTIILAVNEEARVVFLRDIADITIEYRTLEDLLNKLPKIIR